MRKTEFLAEISCYLCWLCVPKVVVQESSQHLELLSQPSQHLSETFSCPEMHMPILKLMEISSNGLWNCRSKVGHVSRSAIIIDDHMCVYTKHHGWHLMQWMNCCLIYRKCCSAFIFCTLSDSVCCIDIQFCNFKYFIFNNLLTPN